MGTDAAVGQRYELVTIHILAAMEFNPIFARPQRSLVRVNSG